MNSTKSTPESVRREWMTLYGLLIDEIEQNIIDFPPTSLEEELIELDAMKQIVELNKTHNIKDYVRKFNAQ